MDNTLHTIPTAANRKLHTVSRAIFICASILISIIIFVDNISIFGLVTRYSSISNTSDLTPLGPKERVGQISLNGSQVIQQNDDLIYFTTSMPRKFETAKVTVTYKNDTPEQDIRLGFQDKPEWHYNWILMDSPTLNSIPWERIGSKPALFQRSKKYETVSNFYSGVNNTDVIGFYNYDITLLPQAEFTLQGYQTSRTETVIDTPLRGRHVMFAYLDNELFKLTVEKQDLNWYENPDIMTVDIYKDKTLVYRKTIEDDGITDTSKKILPPQIANIQNPGPELPEPGLYKIVIDTTGDSVIKKIKTNLHKIVFDGPIYPVSNAQVYPDIVASTSATLLYTSDTQVVASTVHPNTLQILLLDKEQLPLINPHKNVSTSSATPFQTIEIPKSDVVINGVPGFYAFSQSQFFIPTPYSTYQITPGSSVDHLDYILANYEPPVADGEWRVATNTFDLKTAVVKNGRLSWIIIAPGLKENGRKVYIKQIDVELRKKPLF